VSVRGGAVSSGGPGQAERCSAERFLAGAAAASELGWFTPAGTAITAADWSDRSALAVAIYLDGSDQPDRAADGSPLTDDDFLVLVNASWQPLGFTVPATRAGTT
jgi:isoamylase